MTSLIDELEITVHFIREKSKLKPRIGLILGSGLGSFVNHILVETIISFEDLPFFAPTSVEGHEGQLILGYINKVPVVVLKGRVHYYEGHTMNTVTYPIRTLAMLGIETLILTNSAGGLEPQMTPGDLMIISDHINLMGDNPLRGPNLKTLGPRFPDMSSTYDPELIQKMEEIFRKLKTPYHKGVYCGMSGPTYETPAEVRFLKIIGGNAVGMSTVPEAIAGNHLGLRVCAISCISNLGAGLSSQPLSHQEVIDAAKKSEKPLSNFLLDFISQL